MGNSQAELERRKDKRFQINERAIAVLNVGTSFARLGRIVDVSRGGLAFDYLLLDGATPPTRPEDEVGEIFLNIITEDGAMALAGISVDPVSDRLLPRRERFFEAVPTCRCGIRFNNPTPDQEKQIGDFLLNRAMLND